MPPHVPIHKLPAASSTHIMNDTGTIAGYVFVYYKPCTIVFTKPISGTKPHETFLILNCTHNVAMRQALLNIKM